MSHAIRNAVINGGALLGLFTIGLITGGATVLSHEGQIRAGLNDAQLALVEGIGGQMPPTPTPDPGNPETFIGKCFATYLLHPGQHGALMITHTGKDVTSLNGATLSYDGQTVTLTDNGTEQTEEVEEGFNNGLDLKKFDPEDGRYVVWGLTKSKDTPDETAFVSVEFDCKPGGEVK